VDGHVAVDTVAGRGTVFDLFFPAADPSDRNCASLGRQLDRWVNEGGARGGAIDLSPGRESLRPVKEE
jgi:hypothetical protein